MTLTIFTPDWGETPERPEGSVCIGDTDPSEIAQGCTVILLRDINETPKSLSKIPMRVIRVIMPDLAVTKVADDEYKGCNVIARVKAHTRGGGVRRQSITLTGTNGITLEAMNDWFRTLCAEQSSST